jgi:nucleotide-binding universal stress UspA family protein
MSVFSKICVGTNFSPEADRALEAAAHLARMLRAEVLVVHVVQVPRLYQRLLSPIQSRLHSVEEASEQAAERCRTLVAAPFLKGVPVDYQVRTGVPFVDLIDAARIWHADLVLLGHSARSGAQRLLLGSTAERVLRKSTIPVLITKKAFTGAPRAILAPTDLSEGSEPALQVAALLARCWSARLTLLHVVEPVAQAEVWPLDPASAQLFLAEPEELEPEWRIAVEKIQLSGVNFERRTLKGSAATEITRTADELAAELIVMGTHGRSGLVHALLGSVTEQVAREAECSVLTVRAKEFRFALP